MDTISLTDIENVVVSPDEIIFAPKFLKQIIRQQFYATQRACKHANRRTTPLCYQCLDCGALFETPEEPHPDHGIGRAYFAQAFGNRVQPNANLARVDMDYIEPREYERFAGDETRQYLTLAQVRNIATDQQITEMDAGGEVTDATGCKVRRFTNPLNGERLST